MLLGQLVFHSDVCLFLFVVHWGDPSVPFSCYSSRFLFCPAACLQNVTKPLQGLIPSLLPFIEWISMFCPLGCTTSLTLVAYTFAHYYLLSHACKERHAHKSIQCSVGVQHTLSPTAQKTVTLATDKWLRRNIRDCDIRCLFDQQGRRQSKYDLFIIRGCLLAPKYTSGIVSEMVHGILKVLLLVYFIISTSAHNGPHGFSQDTKVK